jgi:hypothetical protein
MRSHQPVSLAANDVGAAIAKASIPAATAGFHLKLDMAISFQGRPKIGRDVVETLLPPQDEDCAELLTPRGLFSHSHVFASSPRTILRIKASRYVPHCTTTIAPMLTRP